MDTRVVEIPKFRTLVLGVPLAEFIAKGEYPFLRPGFFFVPPRTADAGAKTKFLYRIKQGDRLMRVAAFIGSFQDDSSAHHGVLHGAHDETLTQLRRSPVAKFDHFGKIVGSVDVQQGKRKPGGPECFLGQTQKHQGVLTAGKQQSRIPAFRGHFPQDVNGLALQSLQMSERVTSVPRVGRHWRLKPESRCRW